MCRPRLGPAAAVAAALAAALPPPPRRAAGADFGFGGRAAAGFGAAAGFVAATGDAFESVFVSALQCSAPIRKSLSAPTLPSAETTTPAYSSPSFQSSSGDPLVEMEHSASRVVGSL